MRRYDAVVMAAALALTWISGTPPAHAQGCCSVGGAAGQIGLFRQSRLAPGQAVFGLFLGRTAANQSYEATQTVDDPQARRASLHSLSGSLAVGLPWRFTAFVAVPVAWRERSQQTVYAGQPVDVAYEGKGWADPVAALSWRITPLTKADGFLASLGTGVQVPLGEDEVRTNGVRLPNDVQPATGDWNLLFFQTLELTHGDWQFFEHGAYTMTWANTVDYTLGPSLRADLGTSASWVGPLEPFMRLDLLVAGSDSSGDRELPSTGSTRLYAVPGLALNLRPQRIVLFVEIGMPLYQHFEGNQLGTGTRWQLGLSYLL